MEYQNKRKKLHKKIHHTKRNLENIQENENIIIKKADMESAVVILNKTNYWTKIQEILKDETNNKLIDTNIDNNII